VIAGLMAARSTLVGTSMPMVLQVLRKCNDFFNASSVDGAIGSRWIAGSTLTVRQGVLRQLESRAFNLLIRVLFGLSYHDTTVRGKGF